MKSDFIDWIKVSVDYEIEYSKARGGILEIYPDFIHISNKKVPYGGDYNRTVAVKTREIKRFKEIIKIVEKIHETNRVFPPDRFDFIPPKLDSEWENISKSLGYKLKTSVYLKSLSLFNNFSLYPYNLYFPSEKEFKEWYIKQQKAKPYWTENILEKIVFLQIDFIKVFKPFWLMKDEEIIGWVYCQLYKDFFHVFELELIEKYRGKGIGRIFIELIKIEACRCGAKFVIIQTNPEIKNFYIKCGFDVISENNVLIKK
jgi:GNAT superfamily N-acetyltransferase